ncbi:MAG: acetylornithine/succinylornithine family transaminase [Acidimicrobiales bacterium]|nr:acetylornithine/succinylornithine family transaminase [Acidimicrobiales bacterium]
MPTYKKWPVTFVSGSGSYLIDTTGKKYLDFLSGIAVCSLGHCHPKVTEALTSQANTLWHVSNLFGNEIAPQVAHELDLLIRSDYLDTPGKVFFTNSGAEANECAFKLARLFGGRGRHVVLSAYGSFHGRTLATLHATGQPEKHEPFWPLPEGFSHIAFNDYKAFENAIKGNVAALIIEPTQGEGGVIVPEPGYLRQVRELCSEMGILMIADEVQTGLGRMGTWFRCHIEDVVPDIVTVAKSLGNGMPIGACWAKAEIADLFSPGDHGSTFGGQPLASSAALATLAELRAIDAPNRAMEYGKILKDNLMEVDHVIEISGDGLLLGVKVGGNFAQKVAENALQRGLIVNPVRPDVIRMAPPLNVSDAEITEAISKFSDSLKESLSNNG